MWVVRNQAGLHLKLRHTQQRCAENTCYHICIHICIYISHTTRGNLQCNRKDSRRLSRPESRNIPRNSTIKEEDSEGWRAQLQLLTEISAPQLKTPRQKHKTNSSSSLSVPPPSDAATLLLCFFSSSSLPWTSLSSHFSTSRLSFFYTLHIPPTCSVLHFIPHPQTQANRS